MIVKNNPLDSTIQHPTSHLQHQPAIILVRPQMGENIGAVARAMSNFSLNDLRIVAPRDGWPNPKAENMAAGGLSIIRNATIFETLTEAMHGITRAYATTARDDRDLPKRVITVEEMAEELLVASCKLPEKNNISSSTDNSQLTTGNYPTAILFGAERSGLTNEELILADALVSIPVSPENPSLNLAQATVIVGYEWYKQLQAASPQLPVKANPSTGNGQLAIDNSPAPLPELEGMLTHAKELLDAVNYFREPNRMESMWQNLRSRIVALRLTSQDVQTLRGVIRTVLRKTG